MLRASCGSDERAALGSISKHYLLQGPRLQQIARSTSVSLALEFAAIGAAHVQAAHWHRRSAPAKAGRYRAATLDARPNARSDPQQRPCAGLQRFTTHASSVTISENPALTPTSLSFRF